MMVTDLYKLKREKETDGVSNMYTQSPANKECAYTVSWLQYNIL